MGHARLTNTDHSAKWPSYLKKKNTSLPVIEETDKPVVIRMGNNTSSTALEKLISSNPIIQIIDNYDEQFGELIISRHAHLYKANHEVKTNSVATYLTRHYGKKASWQLGSWVYYPWSAKLVHVLEQNLFEELRTIRNKDLITKEEQEIFRNYNVACLGMSVGSSSALALALSGGSQRLKLADGAVISGSNLNRILTSVINVGQEKSLTIARQIYEMNPYAEIHRFNKAIKKELIESVFTESWKTNMIVDEIDDLEIKIRIRIEARKQGIPVLMATELGDNVMVDIERYDLSPNYPLFHGLVKNVEDILEKKEMSQREWMKHASNIIGLENMPLSLQTSLTKIGTKIVTHPQLGPTAMITGGVISALVRQIALGKNIKSGRKLIALDRIFDADLKKRRHDRTHKKHTKSMKGALKSI